MFRKREDKRKTWNPKGGEFEVMPMLVDVEEITGPADSVPYVRPDSGNQEAKEALAAISLDFIMGRPLDEQKMARLGRALPEQPVMPFLEGVVEVSTPTPSLEQ